MAATFTVETGAGLSNANSYTSLAEAGQYHDDYGAPAAWTGAADAVKEAALRVATQYVDAKFGLGFKGVCWRRDQSLDWPRAGVEDESGYLLDADELPQALKDTVSVLALKHIEGTVLLPDIVNDGAVSSTSVKVGPIEESISYVAGKGETDVTTFNLARRLLKDLLVPSGMVVRG